MTPIAENREDGGRLVREAWVRKARWHPQPKDSWLVPWEHLGEWDKEVDRCIWEDIVSPYLEVVANLCTEYQKLREERDSLQDEILQLEERHERDGNTIDELLTITKRHQYCEHDSDGGDEEEESEEDFDEPYVFFRDTWDPARYE